MIAGHSHDHELLARLRSEADAAGLSGRFALVGGEDYLPYEQIVALIQKCSIGLALYNPKPNIRNRIPTKFFEFMAFGKPLIFSENETWDNLNAVHPFGKSTAWPLTKGTLAQAHQLLDTHDPRNTSPTLPRSFWSWESESQNMLHLYQNILRD